MTGQDQKLTSPNIILTEDISTVALVPESETLFCLYTFGFNN